MGLLAEKQNDLENVRAVIVPALNHFDTLKIEDSIKNQIATAADSAFGNPILLEKFQLWNNEQDDEIFLFHINRFFELQHRVPLKPAVQNQTAQRESIESSIKDDVRNRQKRVFGERITQLAVGMNLLRNEDLGVFLEVSTEQARKFRTGDNKPQLATLKKIADKFKVTIGYLIGLEENL